MSDATPIYNLKAVMQETGLSAATLRAWELRYGLPRPGRTAGGHRLYSRQDIEMLKWLVSRQKEGLSISQAVEIWKGLKHDEKKSYVALQATGADFSKGEDMLGLLRDQWMAACVEFDEQKANRVLDQAFSLTTPETVCTQILQNGLAHIGDEWYGGTVSVQQEHFASAIASRRVNTLLAAVAPPTRPERIMVACPPHESHDFILLLISYLLRRRGWDVVYLGADLPLNDMDAAIETTKPALVISAAQTLISAASLHTMSEYLIQQGIPLAYGGGIFTRVPMTTQHISGYYLGVDVPGVPSIIELLIIAPPSMPVAQPTPPAYTRTLVRFLRNQTFIVGYVSSTMQSVPIEPVYLEIANDNLTRLIYSALILGDINLLDSSIEWLEGLLKNHGIWTGVTEQFYTIYRQAIERYLAEDGVMIRDWLSKQLSA